MTRAMFSTLAAAAAALATVLVVPTTARAQATAGSIPPETLKAQTVTTGKTEIAKGGFATLAADAAEDPSHVIEASIAAGGLFTSGNARTVALTGLGKFRIRREAHQFSLQIAGNFARAGKRGTPVEGTVENYQGLLRYDHFLSNEVALFFQSTARRDRFQGLDLRLNFDPGVAYYFLNTKKHRLRAEGGYDLQHDIRRDASRAQPVPEGSPPNTPPVLVDKTQTLHNGRAFVGYDNRLYKEVQFLTSLEYLQSLEDFEVYRLIFDVGLKSNIGENLAIATTYTMRFENRPLPNVERADSIASVNLVYTLF